MAKKYYWLKLKEDFFRDKKVKKLRKIAGGDTYTIIYLKMQLLSLKNAGTLVYEGIEDNFAEEIALEIDEDVENVKVTLMFLMKSGLLEESEQDHYVMTETIKCIGSESASAERVRKHREIKKAQEQKVLQCNAPVTTCNTEIEKREKKEELENKKKDREYFSNEKLNDIFIEFLEVRKKLKAVNSDRALKTLINKLNKYDDATKYQMIENSIVNSWKDVYELKQPKPNASNTYKRKEVVPEWINTKVVDEEVTDGELNDIINSFKKEYKPNPELQERLKNKYGKGKS